MDVLILILCQIIFLALALKIIFSFIDKAVSTCRKIKRLLDTFEDSPQLDSQRQIKDDLNDRLSKIERKATTLDSFPVHSWNQLLTRVQGDVQVAERLITYLKIKHPDKSDRWLIEKAIHDLDRDRDR